MKIMLVCSAGMSTSLLVKKMKSIIAERNLQITVLAASQLEAASYSGAVDVILLGPQVRYLQKKMEDLWNERGSRVAVIDSLSYGTMDGQAVLEQALQLID